MHSLSCFLHVSHIKCVNAFRSERHRHENSPPHSINVTRMKSDFFFSFSIARNEFFFRFQNADAIQPWSDTPIEVCVQSINKYSSTSTERCIDMRSTFAVVYRFCLYFVDVFRAHKILLKLIIKNTISGIYDAGFRQAPRVCVCCIGGAWNPAYTTNILKMKRWMESKKCENVLTVVWYRCRETGRGNDRF